MKDEYKAKVEEALLLVEGLDLIISRVARGVPDKERIIERQLAEVIFISLESIADLLKTAIDSVDTKE